MDDQEPGLMPQPEFKPTPARVNFAFDTVQWVQEVESGSPQRSYEGGPAVTTDGRKLKECEKAVYRAALEVMRLYLTGEMSFENDVVGKSSVDAPRENSKTCFFCKDTGETS